MRVNRVTSVGFSCADPLADSRRLFDISSRLLAQTLPYARRLVPEQPCRPMVDAATGAPARPPKTGVSI